MRERTKRHACVLEGDGLFSPPAVHSSCHGEHGKGAHGCEPSTSYYVVCLIPYSNSLSNSTYDLPIDFTLYLGAPYDYESIAFSLNWEYIYIMSVNSCLHNRTLGLSAPLTVLSFKRNWMSHGSVSFESCKCGHETLLE